MDYIKRIIDVEIDKKIKAFSAINIVGPKGCGKTKTASQRAKTIIAFQDPEKRENYLYTAKVNPTLFLHNEKPILFDEWQDAPAVWDMVRWEADQSDETGEFFLTGSTGKKVKTAHTGTGRISTVEMATMSLLESGESNGSVSISCIFNDPSYVIDGQRSSLRLKDLFYLTCRGGWPSCLKRKDEEARLLIAKDYFYQIHAIDINTLDGKKRNSEWARAILRSYARNIATPVKNEVLFADVKANFKMSEKTFYDYVDALKRLYVIREISAWSPNIRSKTAIRTTTKKIFYDPSLAAASLEIDPDYFYGDLNAFGFFFENLVLRDLSIYLSPLRGTLRHYRDAYGLEADAVLELPNGRYALVEIKTGASEIGKGTSSLLKLKGVIDEAIGKKASPGLKSPDHLILIVGDLDFAYTTKEGVKVIPFGCLGV